MRSTFRILFYVNRSKSKNDMVPIMGRITLNGTIAQFSCRLQEFESFWDVSSNRAVLRHEKYQMKYNTIEDAKRAVEKINVKIGLDIDGLEKAIQGKFSAIN